MHRGKRNKSLQLYRFFFLLSFFLYYVIISPKNSSAQQTTCQPAPTCNPRMGILCRVPTPCGGGSVPTSTPQPSQPTATPPPGCFYQNICPTCTPGTICPKIACAFKLVCPSGAPQPSTPTMTSSPTLTVGPTSSGQPSSTPIPTLTPTPNPNDTVFAVSVCPHGLLNCGDNANPQSHGNQNPLHTSKNITVEVYDANAALVTTKTGSVDLDITKGNFNGTVDIGSVPTGNYIVKVKVENYLRKVIPGIQSISGKQTNTLPLVHPVAGDLFNDNQLNVLDYSILVDCFGDKANSSSCTNKDAADIDDNGQVDGVDYNLLLREWSVQQGD